jgi:hypothetical protein
VQLRVLERIVEAMREALNSPATADPAP